MITQQKATSGLVNAIAMLRANRGFRDMFGLTLSPPTSAASTRPQSSAMADRPHVTLAEAATELRRELGLRQRVYPGWIASGRLKQADADRQIARLERALECVAAEAEKEDRERRLF